MRIGQGVRTGSGHGGITCVLQTQFSSFSCHELSCRSRHGEWVDTPKCIAASGKLRCLLWRETKNSANWCAQQSYGIPCKTDHTILLTLIILFTETYLFLCKKGFPTI